MERLHFDSPNQYSAIEAAVHVNRYALARRLCRGRRVLDLASGEGYGSYLMAERWGATHVTAIDVSEEALQYARKYFESPAITFRCATAENFVDGTKYDLIVCLETFEHVAEPRIMLENFRDSLAEGGIVLISCPNDHWYYRTPAEGNPFHARKYHLDDFRREAEQILGPSSAMLLGTPISGYTNIPLSDELLIPESTYANSMKNRLRDSFDSQIVACDAQITPENCAYFVGAWGPVQLSELSGSTMYPVSMDGHGSAHLALDIRNMSDEVKFLREKVYSLGKQDPGLERAFEREAQCAREFEAFVAKLNGLFDECYEKSQVERASKPPVLPPAESSRNRNLPTSESFQVVLDNTRMVVMDLLSKMDSLSASCSDQSRETNRIQRHAALKERACRSEIDYLREEVQHRIATKEALRCDLTEACSSLQRDLEIVVAQNTELQAQIDWFKSFTAERMSHIQSLEHRLQTLKRPAGLARAIGRKVRSKFFSNASHTVNSRQ